MWDLKLVQWLRMVCNRPTLNPKVNQRETELSSFRVLEFTVWGFRIWDLGFGD